MAGAAPAVVALQTPAVAARPALAGSTAKFPALQERHDALKLPQGISQVKGIGAAAGARYKLCEVLINTDCHLCQYNQQIGWFSTR